MKTLKSGGETTWTCCFALVSDLPTTSCTVEGLLVMFVCVCVCVLVMLHTEGQNRHFTVWF